MKHNFSFKPELTGEKIILRPFEPTDCERMLEILDEPVLKKLTGSVTSDAEAHAKMAPEDEAYVRQWYLTRNEQVDRLDLAVAEKATGQVIGEVVFNEYEAEAGQVNFRVLLSESSCNKGLGTEAISLIIQYGMEVLGLDKIKLSVYSFNPRAERVYQKLGFKLESVAPADLLYNQEPIDSRVYALSKFDYFNQLKGYKIVSFPITMSFGNSDNTVYPTLLWDQHNIILVDCGFIGSLPHIEKALHEQGLSVEQITGLVLTHHDHDHMGAAAAIKRINPHMTVYASAEEAPFINAVVKPLRLQQAEETQKHLPPEQQDFGKVFCDLLRRVEPVQVDVYLQDGEYFDWCKGCRIIATPGHTPGHISLLMEQDAIVITGDAMALEMGEPVIANPHFTLDLEQATASMDKLLSLDAKDYYCYHGGHYVLE